MELKQYWHVVKKRIWLIAVLVCIAGVATGIYSYFFQQPEFEASTKLIVNQTGSQNDIIAKLDLSTINSNIQLVKTYKEIIRTPRVMDKVAQKHPELGLTAGELIERISVTSVNDTQVMSVTAKDSSYSRAANIANAVSEVFMQELPSLMQVDNVSILYEADHTLTPPPVSPKPTVNIAIAIALSMLVGIGFALLLDYLDDTIKTEEDIQAVLGLPTLSLIPKIREVDLGKHKDNSIDQPMRGKNNVTFEA
ncbi:Wzz/FepE/Etk N-terminal domain-containing protein [Paenibacillus sp. FSL H8-0537]|uniref:YveK family protein n=1 Tax=Paenibacillus sp. FSL H8-0537 TaxID=2921399 RepID=UPI003100DAD5